MKLMKVLVAVLVMAAMAVPVIAEDRLQLSGEMRVRGWHDSSEVSDFDFDESKTFADQRLRIGGKIAVAEGVSITFRTDITETGWGSGGSDFGAGRMGGTQQWDRAHIDLTKGNFHLRAGQQYLGTGTAYAFDTQEAGLSLDIVGNVPVKLFMVVDDQNTVADTLGTQGADALEYGFMVSPKGDNFKSNLYVVGQSKRSNSGEEVYLIGANASFDFDAIKLVAELDVFTGDAADDVDAMGTQLFVDVSTALDAVTIGFQGFYAEGADDDEVQYAGLGNGFNGWDPIFDNGTQLSNEEMDLSDNLVCDLVTFLDADESCGGVFDFSGQGAGVVGARLYASTSLGEAKVGASIAYLETEEDENIDAELTALSVGFVYPVMANTTFQAQLQYTDIEVEGVDADSFQVGTGLFVKF